MKSSVPLKQSIKEDLRWLFGGIFVTAAATGYAAVYYHNAKLRVSPAERAKRFKAFTEFKAVPSEKCYNYRGFQSTFEFLLSNYGLSKAKLLAAITHLCPIEFHIYLIQKFLLNIRMALARQPSNEISDIKVEEGVQLWELPNKTFVAQDVDLAEVVQLVQSVIDKFISLNYLPYLSEINFRKVITKWAQETNAEPTTNNKNASNNSTADLPLHMQQITLNEQNIKSLLCYIREAIYDYAVPNWIEMRYFDDITYKDGFFGHQFSVKAIGLSIGTTTAPFLITDQKGTTNYCAINSNQGNEKEKEGDNSAMLNVQHVEADPQHNGMTMKCLEGIQNALKTYGIAVIRNGLTSSCVNGLITSLFRPGFTGKVAAESLMKADGNVFCQKPTLGRIHCLLRGTTIENSVLHVQSVWMPVVYNYLRTEAFSNDAANAFLEKWHRAYGKTSKSKSELVSDFEKFCNSMPNQSYRRLFLSNIQVVYAEPLAISQYWHRENVKPGLTIFVPLANIEQENGTIEILGGSHLLKREKTMGIREKWNAFKCFMMRFEETNGAHVLDLNLGDVLICDSRLVHRLLANESWLTTGVLIIQYDYEEYRPPGQTLFDTRVTAIFGKLLKMLQKLYDIS